MSDSDVIPPRHNARWSDEQKRRVIALRRSGKTYDEIASTMGRTKNSVKSMCERLERAQYSDTEHNNKWNARLLKINAPLIHKPQCTLSATHNQHNSISVVQKKSKQSEDRATKCKTYHTESEEDNDKSTTTQSQSQPQATNTTNNYNYSDYNHNHTTHSHSMPFGVSYAHAHAHAQQTTDDMLYEALAFDETNTNYSNNNELQYSLTSSTLSMNQITDNGHNATTNNNNVISTQQQIPWPANSANSDSNKEQEADITHTETKQMKNTINNETNKRHEEKQKNDINMEHKHEDKQQIEKQNDSLNPNECKDKKKIDDGTNEEDHKNDSDNDCIIISVSDPKTSAVTSTNVAPYNYNEAYDKHKNVTKASASKGNQGSDAEYRRLIQKYGQSMRYEVNEIVTFFVPRLAAKGRFKDRIGKIQCKLLDADSKYQIIDQQNNKQEIVPWKWILKAPPNMIRKKRKRNTKNETEKELIQVQQRKKHKADRIPMQSLKTREEKLAEFNRRMNNKEKQPKYKQYSVPIHASYYEDFDEYSPHRYTQRGRSLHNYNAHNAHNTHNGYHAAQLQPRKHMYHEYEDRYHSHKKKQIRSYSVFPQRLVRRRAHSPLPPLQSVDDMHHDNNNNIHHINHKRSRQKHTHNNNRKKMNVINIADDDENNVEIKPEKEKYHEHAHTRSYRDYHHRKRSRSRSPSHIRPSNRIINNSNNKDVDRNTAASNTHNDHYYNRYRRQSPISNNGYYSNYHHNNNTIAHDSHYRYYKDYHVPSTKRSASRSRSRERERDRDRSNSSRYWREYQYRLSPYSDYYHQRHNDREYRERDRDRESYRDYYHAHHRTQTPSMYMMPYEEDRYYRNETRERRESRDRRNRNRIGIETKPNDNNSLLMQSWLQVSSRMRGGSKLGQREIDYLCQNDVYPEQIKQFMDSDKQIQEKYDIVAHFVDPTNGQNLTRSQVYSIIGAVITMKF